MIFDSIRFDNQKLTINPFQLPAVLLNPLRPSHDKTHIDQIMIDLVNDKITFKTCFSQSVNA
jgi:hypothetical protein